MLCPHDTDGDGDCHLCVGGICHHMPRKITNTQAELRRSIASVQSGNAPLGYGLAALMMATPGSIETSEANGQRELVESCQLPAKMPYKDRLYLESRGVVFPKEGSYSDGDRLFYDVTLPSGWKKQRTDHSMWSELIDEKGVKVASIFYKAAFYDRDAFLDVVYPT